MLSEALSEHDSLQAASEHIGEHLGVSPDVLRVWYKQTQIDTGAKPARPLTQAKRTGGSAARSRSVAALMRPKLQ